MPWVKLAESERPRCRGKEGPSKSEMGTGMGTETGTRLDEDMDGDVKGIERD